jgi:hypothetical protein
MNPNFLEFEPKAIRAHSCAFVVIIKAIETTNVVFYRVRLHSGTKTAPPSAISISIRFPRALTYFSTVENLQGEFLEVKVRRRLKTLGISSYPAMAEGFRPSAGFREPGTSWLGLSGSPDRRSRCS